MTTLATMDLHFRYIYFLGLFWISTADNNSCSKDSECPDHAECACCWQCNCLYSVNHYRNGQLYCHYDEEYVIISCVAAAVFFLIFFTASMGVYMCFKRRRVERSNQVLTLFNPPPAVVGIPPIAQSYQATYSVPMYPAAQMLTTDRQPQLYQGQVHPDPPPPYTGK